ncbi:hypothetical protein F4604DRAFT_1922478 [Suillus subluteus]|nr:hypothetical protein F4604DRAFT_1922478 [Suillus subluteus]
MSIILQDIMCSINIQHNCIDLHCTDTAQQPVYQERTLTSCSRPIVQHKLTPYYFLNVYSIHNYDYIHLVTPNTLHETPLRVTNVAEVRALAVQQMQEKRAAKKSGDVPQQGEGRHIDNIPAPRAVFDRAPTTMKTGAKVKAKTKQSRSTSGLLTPDAARGPGSRSRSGSVQSARSGSRPPSVTGLGTGSIGCAHSPLGFTHMYKPSNGTGSQSQTAVGASGPHDSSQSATSDALLDELITAGVRRRQTDSSPTRGDPTVLTPICTKRLKVYAMKVTGDLGVSEEELHDLIDTGGIYHMLIDIKATLLRRTDDAKKAELTLLKELLDSKDFKSGLQNRLTACMLSPNITAYVTDAHPHVMDFIRDHHNVFKIPVAMLEDVELNAQLSKLVSDLLSSIRGNIKAKTVKSLAHHCGIEVNSMHWNRFAFLWRCLRIFLIGVDDYKAVSLKVLFSNSLIPSLHKDLHVKINEKLGIDIDAIECGIHSNVDQDSELDTPSADIKDPLDEDQPMHDTENADNSGNGGSQQEDEDENVRDEGAEDESQGGEDLPAVGEENSGFKSKGHRTVYSLTKFWKFMDDSLEGIRKLVKIQVAEQGPNGSLTYEHAFHDILVEYFQLDLIEFPGRRVVPKLLSTSSPQWQTTIQNNLFWEN